MTYKPGMTPAEMQRIRDRTPAAALQAAQLSDLRKAFEIATAEIRHLNKVIRKQGKALLRQHNHFRAMQGLPPHPERPGGKEIERTDSARRQAHLKKVKGWYFDRSSPDV
jgi:hypothetical protein